MIIPQSLFNTAAEADLIGTLLQANASIDRAADRLKPSDFHEPTHSALFEIIVKEGAAGKQVTPVTIKPYFEAIEGLADKGGGAYLMQLAATTGAHVTFDGAVDIVAELSRRRRILAGLDAACAMVCDPAADLGDVMATADAALTENTATDGVEQLSAAQCADNLINTFGSPKSGITCRTIPNLDNILGKLRPKELIILAGRPGMGKTAVALSYALGAAQAGFGTMYVSLEMSGTELAARMLADLCFDGDNGVLYSCIRDGALTDKQKQEVWKSRKVLAGLPLRIVDADKLTTSRLSMFIMRTKRRMEAKGQSLDLVIVDYLQLLSPDYHTRGMYEKVSEISMALKAIAKTHGVSIMALAQLSREVEKRPDRMPQLADLRDSGQIEQDADGVVFLVRQAYYLTQEEPDHSDPSHAGWLHKYEAARLQIEFIVAKRRNGETGKAEGLFFGQFQAVRGKHG
jgi:replicative DNA helicase